jgi:hypothetical protein
MLVPGSAAVSVSELVGFVRTMTRSANLPKIFGVVAKVNAYSTTKPP